MVKSPKQTDWEGEVGDSEEDPSAFRQLFRFAISFVAELALLAQVQFARLWGFLLNERGWCVRVPWLARDNG
jgi:hypothetical protein